MRRLSLLTLIFLGPLGCLPEPDPGGEIPPPPPSCQNGLCEPTLGETCLNCKQDCPCCAAIFATGTMNNPEWAVGKSDGKSVTLEPYSVLELTLGRSIDDQPDQKVIELELVGTVATGSGTPAGCVTQAGIAGAIQVKANDEGTWRQIGLWAVGGSAQLDLGCGLVKRTSLIRLEAQGGAKAQLDAVRLLSCSE